MTEFSSGSCAGSMAFSANNTAMSVTGNVNCNNAVNVTNNNYPGSTSSNIRKIASWLCVEQYQASHDEHHMRRAEGTLEGFLKSDVYTAWVRDKGMQFLHLECRGMPGAGKSTLASAVVEDLQSRLSSTTDLIAYAYFRYDSQKNQTPEFVIANLLGQAIKKCGEVSTEVLALYEEYYTPDAKTVPRLDKTIHAFRLIASGRKVYIVLDALDEYSVEHYDKALPLINALRPLNAKLLVTSRYSVPFPSNNFSSFEVHAEPSDIRILIMEHVKNYQRLAKFIEVSPQLLEEIITKITKRARGMFVIVTLQLNVLSSQMTPHGVRKELKHLPAGLDRTYELAMERVHQQSPELAHIADEAFGWVFYAVTPLSIQQLQHAVSFDITERRIGSDYLIPIEDILAACCGLIVVVNDRCQFVHFSTKEFFQKLNEKYLPDAERRITEKCLCYAAVAAAKLAELDSDEAIEHEISSMSLCTYASSYWGSHASHIVGDVNQPEQLVDDLIKHVLWPRMVDEQKIGIYSASKLPSQHCLILYLARYGLIKLFQLYWNKNALAAAITNSDSCFPDNPNIARGGDGWAAIHSAARNNHDDIVQFLIEQGVDVNSSTRRGETALHLSASSGHDSITLTLLENGADPNAQDKDGNTPLYEAINSDHPLVATTILLSSRGARSDIANKYGWTLLHVAARKGHDCIVLTLLSMGLDPNAQDEDGETPLHEAVHNGHLSVATILFNCGARSDMVNKYAWTLLHVAARMGRDTIVLTLLDKGLNPNAQDVYGNTPLHEAIDYGHLSFATILLDNGACPDVASNYGRTLLHVAASKGRDSIASTLLGKGLDPNAQDTHGNTPLHEAIGNGHLSLAIILLGIGARLDVASNYGSTLLHVAASKGRYSIVMTLLGKGLYPNPQDKYGNTPLHKAISNYHPLLVQALLDNGADVNSSNIYGETALHNATKQGHASLLLDAGADLEIKTHDHKTPLLYATWFGRTKVVSLLVKRGADLFVIDKDGKTALDHAFDKQCPDIVNSIIVALIKKYWLRATSLTPSYPNRGNQASNDQHPVEEPSLQEPNNGAPSLDMRRESSISLVSLAAFSHGAQVSITGQSSLEEMDHLIPETDADSIRWGPLISELKALAESPYCNQLLVLLLLSLLILAVAIWLVRLRS